MIEQKRDAPKNPPYWVCTNCKWAFESLQAANRHSQNCLVNEHIEEKNEQR
jgi:hypothetical protein